MILGAISHFPPPKRKKDKKEKKKKEEKKDKRKVDLKSPAKKKSVDLKSPANKNRSGIPVLSRDGIPFHDLLWQKRVFLFPALCSANEVV